MSPLEPNTRREMFDDTLSRAIKLGGIKVTIPGNDGAIDKKPNPRKRYKKKAGGRSSRCNN